MTPERRLAIAIEIAQEAGERIKQARQNADFKQSYKYGSELVTEVDVAIDEYIASALEEAFPGEARLTEELSPDRDMLNQEGPLWIVDPIDGTVNFAHGQHHVAVSIAWAENGKTRLGVVHAPFLDETFTALRGEGANMNGQPITASKAKRLEEALVGTGFPYDRDARLPLLRRLQLILEHCRDIRRNGAAALDLCAVACGRLDAYYESTSPWDFAAGLLIAREAGAKAGHIYRCPDGIPPELYGENLLVSAPDLHAEIKQLIERADSGQLH
ncbi:inositol monophosphatase family protein [Phytohalomonas tamaricis]|uniref:inositol monophosphatase family protein n=1 Tax=Phytohalomonas tamaricis TaxID=2081032 RepID=UPI000D0AC814|nr:inositol monophosphatase family protein [Phytohalomonas tamaricis]